MNHKINFSPRQKLPPGYTIEWWDSDGLYHWIISEDLYGVGCCDRWQSWRGAWLHHLNKEEK